MKTRELAELDARRYLGPNAEPREMRIFVNAFLSGFDHAAGVVYVGMGLALAVGLLFGAMLG